MPLPVTLLNRHHDDSLLQRVWLAACTRHCDPFPLNREKESCPDTIFLPVSRTGTAARKDAPKCHYFDNGKGCPVQPEIVNGARAMLSPGAVLPETVIFLYCVKKNPAAPDLSGPLPYSQFEPVQTGIRKIIHTGNVIIFLHYSYYQRVVKYTEPHPASVVTQGMHYLIQNNHTPGLPER